MPAIAIVILSDAELEGGSLRKRDLLQHLRREFSDSNSPLYKVGSVPDSSINAPDRHCAIVVDLDSYFVEPNMTLTANRKLWRSTGRGLRAIHSFIQEHYPETEMVYSCSGMDLEMVTKNPKDGRGALTFNSSSFELSFHGVSEWLVRYEEEMFLLDEEFLSGVEEEFKHFEEMGSEVEDREFKQLLISLFEVDEVEEE